MDDELGTSFGASWLTTGFISGGPFHLLSCSTQDNDSSIKFSGTHQMAVSTAPPSSLFSTCCIFPTRGKCAAGSSVWTLCNSASSPHRHAQICPQIFTNLWCAQHNALDCSSFPSLPNHRFRLFPTLYLTAPTTHRAQIHSFTRSGTDRPSRPICSSHLQISRCCVHFLLIYPATNTLFCRLVTAPKTSLSRASYWTLACP